MTPGYMAYTHGANFSCGEGTVISDGCRIGNNVTLGAGVYLDYDVIVRDNVTIGDNTTIGARCILGERAATWYDDHGVEASRLSIGADSVIRSECIFYEGSEFGDHFQTGHRVTVRERTKVGSHCSLGTLDDVQGDCVLGDYVRCHSNVHIGQKTHMGSFVWVFPYVVFTNDPTPPSEILAGVTVESFAVIATSSTILPGVTIQGDSLVAAGATVSKDVEAGTVVGGTPAKVISTTDRVLNHVTGEPAYPWRYHFNRGMPWNDIGFDEWVHGLDGHEIDDLGIAAYAGGQ